MKKEIPHPNPPHSMERESDISVLKPDILLQPLLLEIPKLPNVDAKIAQINEL